MKEIHDHKVNGLNDAIAITADAPGSGGASHIYTLSLCIPGDTPLKDNIRANTVLSFQNGPISTPQNFNGITNEALLAVLIDRMRGFQFSRDPDGNFSRVPGQFACKENACALTHMEEALMWLQKRTRDRMARGVEGTLQA